MPVLHPRIDAYTGNAADFARPILQHIRDDTCKRRLETAVEWVAAGKPRHWKYAGC